MANWWEPLDKKRGSRPRCVLLTDGRRADVAARLTNLVSVPEVAISAADHWRPGGKANMAEAQFGNPQRPNDLASPELHQQLQNWWLQHSATTPNWDIASTCQIRGQPGLLLVEAKAHLGELRPKADSCSSTNPANRKQIQQAIEQANAALSKATGNPWWLSRDHHYQLSNRFAWAWRLADLGVPVALLYLGFLNAQEMIRADTEPFQSAEQWADAVQEYGAGVVENACWDQWLDIGGTPLLPLLRAYDQPFYP